MSNDKILCMVGALRGLKQDTPYHPETDVFEHTAQVVQRALKESTDTDLHYAALLHDVGKLFTRREDHALIGAEMIEDFVTEKTHWLVANHMRMHLFNDGRLKKPGKAIKLYSHPWFSDLVLLSRWDIMGREPGVVTKSPLHQMFIF